MSFFQFLFLWIFGGKKGRQELNQTLDRQIAQYRLQKESDRRFIESINKMMDDTNETLNDVLEENRRSREVWKQKRQRFHRLQAAR